MRSQSRQVADGFPDANGSGKSCRQFFIRLKFGPAKRRTSPAQRRDKSFELSIA
jgi:hypothetical protein